MAESQAKGLMILKKVSSHVLNYKGYVGSEPGGIEKNKLLVYVFLCVCVCYITPLTQNDLNFLLPK